MTSSDQSESGNGRTARNTAASDIELINAGFRYAFSLTHHRHDAEDLIQQACLQVFRRKGSLVTRGYLFTTIRNIFRDACRRRSLLTFEGLTEETTVVVGVEQRNEAKLDLETVLATLKSNEREVLYLHNIEGFTAREISEITKQPRGTILSQLARVKQKLSDRFCSAATEERQSQ